MPPWISGSIPGLSDPSAERAQSPSGDRGARCLAVKAVVPARVCWHVQLIRVRMAEDGGKSCVVVVISAQLGLSTLKLRMPVLGVNAMHILVEGPREEGRHTKVRRISQHNIKRGPLQLRRASPAAFTLGPPRPLSARSPSLAPRFTTVRVARTLVATLALRQKLHPTRSHRSTPDQHTQLSLGSVHGAVSPVGHRRPRQALENVPAGCHDSRIRLNNSYWATSWWLFPSVYLRRPDNQHVKTPGHRPM